VQRLRLLTWNLFHGRDYPPDERLFTWRSRLFRVTERGGRYAQVNRPLGGEFAEVLDRLEWDIAFLQEAPPRWTWPFEADLARVLTSRNSAGGLRALAARVNPDLVASSEGGSNQVLVRRPWRLGVVESHQLARRPERRMMILARVEAPDGRVVAVANLHGSVDTVPDAREQVLDAAARAVEFAGDLPLVFGGDLNLRMSRQPDLFDALRARFGLAPPTDRTAIDHLLLRGFELIEAPHRLPDAAREVPAGDDEHVLQLSDHSCVAAVAGMK
jgi:endonuclease/exonuclease/phosphatase family metal-dependent hydrolase